jgi:outer membrane protein assembly factor BamD
LASHVEDARDRLVSMNRPVPEPTDAAVAENDAENKSMQPIRFTNRALDIIKRGPTVVEAAHVGEPSLDDPKRTLAPDVTKENVALFYAAVNDGKSATPAAVKPTGPNEPPRSDQPSTVQLAPPDGGGTGVGVSVVSAPNGDAAGTPSGNSAVPAGAPGDPNNALVKPVGPNNTTLPAVDKPAEAPDQVNDIKPGTAQQQTAADAKKKKTKADLDEESSSKKKKKKGLGKLNPF